MANFDLVLAYDAKSAGELRKQRLLCPDPRPDNRMPTTADLRWAVDALDNATYDCGPRNDDEEWCVQEVDEAYWIRIAGFDWSKPNSTPGESFFIYGGTSQLGIAIVIKLAERCGQLIIWPDSGAPPIIVDGDDDAKSTYETYVEFGAEADDWEPYFEQMYGRD
jgi:hypothetical protein